MGKKESQTVLKDVLALDGMFGFLTQYERYLCHLSLLGKSTKLTEKINSAKQLIIDEDWKAPPNLYQHDRVLYYDIDGKWVPASQYKDSIEKEVNKKLK